MYGVKQHLYRMSAALASLPAGAVGDHRNSGSRLLSRQRQRTRVVVVDVSEALDALFLTRLEDLLDGRNVAEVCREALVSRTYLDQIRRGDRRKLSYSIVRRLAAALGVRTSYLGEGLLVEDEGVTNLAQLHAWDQRITRQRMHYFERILAQQQAMAAATQPSEKDELLALADAAERQADAAKRSRKSVGSRDTPRTTAQAHPR